jgi:hypothetical protein
MVYTGTVQIYFYLQAGSVSLGDMADNHHSDDDGGGDGHFDDNNDSDGGGGVSNDDADIGAGTASVSDVEESRCPRRESDQVTVFDRCLACYL